MTSPAQVASVLRAAQAQNIDFFDGTSPAYHPSVNTAIEILSYLQFKGSAAGAIASEIASNLGISQNTCLIFLRELEKIALVTSHHRQSEKFWFPV